MRTAFAIRRSLSDGNRKEDGGANIRRKNRKYLTAGFTVFFLLFGSVQVWAAEESDTGWEEKIQEEENSLSEIITLEKPYTSFSEREDRLEFVRSLSEKELYQLRQILPYLIVKEQIQREDASWKNEGYLEVVREWNRRENKNGTEEEAEQLEKDVITLLPEYGEMYLWEGEQRTVDHLKQYEEYLQTKASFLVKERLKEIQKAGEAEDISVLKVGEEKDAKDKMNQEKRPAGACRIGNVYYADLSEALEAVRDNETIYVVQDHALQDSFVSVEKARAKVFQNVKILPEGGARTISMPNRNRLAFERSKVFIGSKDTGTLTFDLSQTSVSDTDNMYCGAICANKGSSLVFENCIFQNGYDMKRWMVHGEYGSVTVEQCRFVNCASGIGVISNASTGFSSVGIHLRVENSVFENISEEGGIHFSVFGADIHSEILKNTFQNCRIGISGIRDEKAPYSGQIRSLIRENKFQNCYVGENFSQGPSFKSDAFQITITNEVYHGWKSSAQNPNVGDLYAGWFSTGLCNSNVSLSVNGCDYENGVHGIATMSKGKTTISGTTVAGNHAQESNSNQCGQKGNGGGIFIDGGIVIWNSGTIRDNQADQGGAVYLKNGEFHLKDGMLYGNHAERQGGGVLNQNGILCQEGGRISANTGERGAGVYQNGVFQMSGAALVEEGNDVYLPSEKYIEVTGSLQSVLTARVTPDQYKNGRMTVKMSYGNRLGSTVWNHFCLTPQGGYCLRPGDYQDRRSGTLKEAVVVSSKYTIQYDKNTKAQVENMPESSVKYWYEKARVSEQVPEWMDVPFLGWNENPSVKEGQYQAGEDLPAEKNQDLILYAVWEDRVLIRYLGNHAESGTKKSETISYADCLKSGYDVHKNQGYTDYRRDRHTFAGWDHRAETGAKEASFQEKQENKISYEELRKIAVSQKTESEDSKEMAKVSFYAIWDRTPEISAPDKEYFEGETVKREHLLQHIESTDPEDGDLVEQVKVIQIEYAPGKVMENGKADRSVQTWKDGMTEEDILDTWFLQLDKKDSPVTHKVTYQVVDSIGNVTEKTCHVAVKYNEFPVIEAQDRYFTLEEARNGKITESVLKEQAVTEGKLKAEDLEEGNLSKKLKLLDFHPEEFQAFTNSGYVMLNWHVQDSMGPDQKGKETIVPFLVYVVKDGEVPKVPEKQNVRFINETYYRLNQETETESLTEAEKAEYNKNGGLCVDSKWYQEEEYRKLIEDTWKKTSGKVYRFTHEDARRAEDFVEVHGIGNSENANALALFAGEFLK